ncbi:DUF3450 domain-containing protein [Halomonas sp. I5-271120]|uniref:DUF3450 domain-containing protein n=1 Tax=Halomonas sp. I5-271120 TaxID=3061632 RepID=UPI00271534E3|nr:DUF3450 domain-containing protein [Halomonas sp. I5-271120]
MVRHTLNRWQAGLALSLALAAPVAQVSADEAMSAENLSAETLSKEALAAEETQAALQARIDAADDATRADIEALRERQAELRQLTAYNRELAPRLDQQASTLDEREAALYAFGDTREALPGMLRDLVERLRQWIEADLPFLKKERLARVDSLEAQLADGEVSHAEALDRVLAAWRRELDYGRELDAWRGLVDVASMQAQANDAPTDSSQAGADESLSREVDFLRIGRAGLYYLTPDGREGGVWKAAAGEWQPLNGAERAELDKGLRIARDQRAPELLALPISQTVSDAPRMSTSSTAVNQRSEKEGDA